MVATVRGNKVATIVNRGVVRTVMPPGFGAQMTSVRHGILQHARTTPVTSHIVVVCAEGVIEQGGGAVTNPLNLSIRPHNNSSKVNSSNSHHGNSNNSTVRVVDRPSRGGELPSSMRDAGVTDFSTYGYALSEDLICMSSIEELLSTYHDYKPLWDVTCTHVVEGVVS